MKGEGAKILLLDIETLYMEVNGIWDLKTRYIQPDRILKDWSIICYSARWLFGPEVMGESVKPEEAIARTEKSIIQGLWELVDDADVIVTHNGIDYDMRAVNSKFVKHGLPPPSHYLNVDTKVEARKHFRLPSYKLDYLAKLLLGLDGKHDMHIEDWDLCSIGDQAALDKMLWYCKNDVAPLLEDLYLKMRPWMTTHPNINIFTSEDASDCCSKCGGEIEIKEDTWKTPSGLWKAYRCKNCGGIGRTNNKIKKTGIK